MPHDGTSIKWAGRPGGGVRIVSAGPSGASDFFSSLPQVPAIQPVAARSPAGNVAASERALGRQPLRARPMVVPYVQVADKSLNPGGQAPGASDFLSSLSWPTAAGEVERRGSSWPVVAPPGRGVDRGAITPRLADDRPSSFRNLHFAFFTLQSLIRRELPSRVPARRCQREAAVSAV
jgi:hypothetical protein